MDDMKDSGIPWLGEIPAEWDITRLKYFINIFSGDFIDRKEVEDNGLYPVFGGGECIGYTNKYNVDKKSIIIGRVGARCGCVNLLHEKAWATDNALILETTLNVRYCYYLLLAADLNKLNHSNAQPLITGYKIKNSFYPFIKLNEQQRIADFLDEKCGEIDGIVAKIQQEMETLKQYKQSIISEAVTKGIRPNVPLKDSGIDYIGKIPESWDIWRVGNIGKLQNGISKDSKAFGYGYPFISYGDVYRNIALPEEFSGLVNSTGEERKKYSVEQGDIFFTRTSETIEEVGFSSVCEKTIPNATFAGFLIRLRPTKNKIFTNFAKYYFRSTHLRFYLVKEMNIVTRASLGQLLLKNMPVLLPPLEEQREIAAYLDQKCAAIDGIISSKEEQLQTLSSYKKSLIYEYVTGKKRVPTA